MQNVRVVGNRTRRTHTKGNIMTPQTKQRLEWNEQLMNRARMHKEWARWFELLMERTKLQNLAYQEENAA